MCYVCLRQQCRLQPRREMLWSGMRRAQWRTSSAPMSTQRMGGRPICCAATRTASGSGRPRATSSAVTTAARRSVSPRASSTGRTRASGAEHANATGTCCKIAQCEHEHLGKCQLASYVTKPQATRGTDTPAKEPRSCRLKCESKLCDVPPQDGLAFGNVSGAPRASPACPAARRCREAGRGRRRRAAPGRAPPCVRTAGAPP